MKELSNNQTFTTRNKTTTETILVQPGTGTVVIEVQSTVGNWVEINSYAENELVEIDTQNNLLARVVLTANAKAFVTS